MIKAIKRLNSALPGLLLGILLYGLAVQFIGVWFVSDKLRYSTGLWIGIACAMGMGIHLAVVIDDAVRIGGSSKMLSVKSVLRYLVVVAVFFIMMYFHLGNIVTAFIGVLGLKVSAYVQPFMHKVILRDDLFEESQDEQKEEVKL